MASSLRRTTALLAASLFLAGTAPAWAGSNSPDCPDTYPIAQSNTKKETGPFQFDPREYYGLLTTACMSRGVSISYLNEDGTRDTIYRNQTQDWSCYNFDTGIPFNIEDDSNANIGASIPPQGGEAFVNACLSSGD